jgi:Restriction endonuclease
MANPANVVDHAWPSIGLAVLTFHTILFPDDFDLDRDERFFLDCASRDTDRQERSRLWHEGRRRYENMRLYLHPDSISYRLIQAARALLEALITSDRVALLSEAEELGSLGDEAGFDLRDAIQSLNDAMVPLDTVDTTELWTPPEQHIAIVSIIRPVSIDLIQMINNDPTKVFEITPRQFEQLIADIFRRHGFVVDLIQETRDGGKDIVAFSQVLNVRSKYIIECKRYRPERKVGIEIVQRLLGVKLSTGANKAIVATTSSFTTPAVREASQHSWDLELKAYDDIMDWIRSAAALRNRTA